MVDIFVKDLVKSFEVGNNLLDGLSFEVQQGERVGLLGKNGAGKTTVFRILTGEIGYDEGTVEIAPGKKLGLISQIPKYPQGYTVEDVLRCAFLELRNIQKKMQQLEQQMTGEVTDSMLREYDRLTNRYQTGGGYDMDVNVDKICNGLGIPKEMRTQDFTMLSGGEKTRVNLARLLLEETDILLLDEPTNHLDMKSVEWLEEYLLKFKGTVLTISHDRYFLDQVVDRIVELRGGKAENYSGNYSFYVEEKEARFELQLKQYEQEQAKIAQLSYTMERMKGWGINNRTLYRRAMSIQSRIDRIEKTERPTREKTMQASFGQREFHGDEVMVLRDLSMGFEDRTLFSNVNLLVQGGERIALLGDNGTGKSTFLKLLMKEEKPTGGKIKFGPSVKMAYLPQIIHFAHPERSVLDTMIYEKNYSTQTARNRLGAFLFSGEDVFKPVLTLSGGEQSRLRLCVLMDEEINLLILDEPTNHLDIASREWIENAVAEFQGTLLFVKEVRAHPIPEFPIQLRIVFFRLFQRLLIGCHIQIGTGLCVAAVQRHTVLYIDSIARLVLLDGLHIVPDFALEADVRYQAAAGFRVCAGHIACIRVAIGIAVFHIEQDYKFIPILNRLCHFSFPPYCPDTGPMFDDNTPAGTTPAPEASAVRGSFHPACP